MAKRAIGQRTEAGGDEIEVAGTTAEDRDWLLGIGCLSGRVAGCKRLKTQGGNYGDDSSPQSAFPRFSFRVGRQVNQDTTPRKPMS